jgi:hypothetical protein
VLNATIAGGQHAHHLWAAVGTPGQLAQPVAVSRELFPPITAHRAALELPLLGSALRANGEEAAAAALAAAAAAAAEEEAAAEDLAAGSMDGPPAAAAAAAAAGSLEAGPAGRSPGRLRGPRRPSLPFLGRGRAARARHDPELLLRVAGSNLHYCHYISVRIFGQAYAPAGPAPAELARDELTDPPPQHGPGALRLASRALHLARQAAGAAYQLARGSRGGLHLPQPQPSELLLRVPVPPAVLARLRAAAASGAGAGQLVEVVLRSDFQQAAVPVEVRGPRVALLGLRPEAAAVVLAGLAGALQLPRAAGSARPLARWLPGPQWLSGLRRGAVTAGRAVAARVAGGPRQPAAQADAAAAAAAGEPARQVASGPWGPVSAAAAAAAAAAALQVAPGMLAGPLPLPPPPLVPPGVIGRAAVASEGFVAATGRLVYLSRQLRLSARGPSVQEELAGPPLDQAAASPSSAAAEAAGGAARQAGAATEAQAAGVPPPRMMPNARLAVGGAVRKIISMAKRKGQEQQQQEEEQGQQQPVAAGGPSKRQRRLPVAQGGAAAGSSAGQVDVYRLGSSGAARSYAAEPGPAAAATQGPVSSYSFTMRAAPPTAVQAADAAPALAAASRPPGAAGSAAAGGWRFSRLLRVGGAPAALAPAAGAAAAGPVQQPGAPAARLEAAAGQAPPAAAASRAGGLVWSPEGLQLLNASPAGRSWQQAALELAQQLQQDGQQQEPSGDAGWKALPGRVLQAAGAIAKGITSMALQPVAEALLPGAQQQLESQQEPGAREGEGCHEQRAPAMQQPAPQVLLLVADAADQQQLEQLGQSAELQRLLLALAATGAAVLPVLLYDPDEDDSRQVQRARQALAAALETGGQLVQLLPVGRELLLSGRVQGMSEQRQRGLQDGLGLLKLRLVHWLDQHGEQQAAPAAPQLQAKL